MVALFLHEESGAFLEFREKKQEIFCFLCKPVPLHSGFAYFHSEQPTLYQQENEIFSLHLPTVPSRNVNISSLHICFLQKLNFHYPDEFY